ncbi:hypothetical protein [Flavobacterium subsaxonicum]|uniref:DUF4488 domain-containing protein n=1 Tax=Flavobacterium subsaxonicum WB 4.1-42 = DSM 21790 TaxID=1121898 RepID=A0A0A2MLQ0_9FLAO|nr:hypothetical protein [Flavobacterium subsaxonicum]KGO92418.1 hypothetical protein Q766_13250 [Flavobacterium subsaxonicum WB 4.1-42 = DSM 21790]
MKRFLLLLLIATTLPSFTLPPTAPFNIVGKWKATEDGIAIILDFDKDGYAIMQKGKDVMGGKEFDVKGFKGSMTYKVDYTKEPDELDIVITNISTGERKVLKGIFKVMGDNQMKVLIGYDSVRPTNFDTPDAMIFTRVTK